MESTLEVLHAIDRVFINGVEGLRAEPFTALFVLASAWPVKGLAFVCVAAWEDVRKRRWLAGAAPFAALSAAIAAVLTAGIKALVDRPRPPLAEAGVDPIGAVPDSSSFPSGHAATAFAAAAAVAAFYPRLRWPVFGLAATVALSRVYLGVHFGFDVAAGALLGVVIGFATAWVGRRLTAHVRLRRRGKRGFFAARPRWIPAPSQAFEPAVVPARPRSRGAILSRTRT